ncbi:MAG: four-carbon acid sugar kinase family protein [Bacillota bacterium]|jgi:uncharacterized protein YgbK (DUF1537 family)
MTGNSDLQRLIAAEHRKIFVLDDDPTGTQTVHGVPVYTSWHEDDLRSAFAEPSRLVYLLTNSRALPASKVAVMYGTISSRIHRLATETGWQFSIIHRSDSTLRGHYPLESEATQSSLQQAGYRFDGEILIPFFAEGGRFTRDDIHWVQEPDRWVPAAETEFAKDATFGYTQSNLKQWIEEKTAGRVQANQVQSISLELLRQAGSLAVRDLLLSGGGFGHYVVNALDYDDLRTFTLGLLLAEQAGKRFLVRSAASFVKVRGGISDRPLLTGRELLANRTGGGLVVVGSHVAKTTTQLQQACQLPGVQAIELSVPRLLSGGRERELERASNLCAEGLASGRTTIVYTSRRLQTVVNAISEANLDISRSVSAALVRLVSELPTAPAFLVAKGGITSSDIATEALLVKRALVWGQIRPGIPVWDTRGQGKYPGLPYIIFPGNVGDDDTLREIVAELQAAQNN